MGRTRLYYNSKIRLTYRIKHCETGVTHRVHHGQLRRFFVPPHYLRNHHCYKRLIDEEPVLEAGESEVQSECEQHEWISNTPQPMAVVVSTWGSISSSESSSESEYTPQSSLESGEQETDSVSCMSREGDFSGDDFLSINTLNAYWNGRLRAIWDAESCLDGRVQSVRDDMQKVPRMPPAKMNTGGSSQTWSILQDCSLFSIPENVEEPKDDPHSLPDLSGVESLLLNFTTPPMVYVDGDWEGSNEEGDSLKVKYRLILPGNIGEELEGLEGLGGSFDCAKDIVEAARDAGPIYWLPRHLAALDLSPTARVRPSVSSAVQRLAQISENTGRSSISSGSSKFNESGGKPSKTVEERWNSLIPKVSERPSVVPLHRKSKDSVKEIPTRISTRSTGPVLTYPHVQPRTLEYRSRGAPNVTITTPSGEEYSG